MIWGFVDYENVGSLEGFSLLDYERVFLFCGPKNTKIKLGELPSTEFCRIELIGIKTIGANNLDFHIAFHLGRLHESAAKDIEFHIITNDTGFNGLINHLKKIDRPCKRISTKNKVYSIELSECANLVVSRIKQIDGRKRPRKKPSLINWINSQCKHMNSEVSAEKIYEELRLSGNISVGTSGVTYHLKH